MTLPIYPLFALLLSALMLLGLLWAWQGNSPKRVVSTLLVLWLAALLFMTGRPGSGGQRINLVPIIVDGPGSARDALYNAAVFIPLGMMLALAGWAIVWAIRRARRSAVPARP